MGQNHDTSRPTGQELRAHRHLKERHGRYLGRDRGYRPETDHVDPAHERCPVPNGKVGSVLSEARVHRLARDGT